MDAPMPDPRPVDPDGDRPVDDEPDDTLPVGLEVPFDEPIADVVDQHREVPLDDDDYEA